MVILQAGPQLQRLLRVAIGDALDRIGELLARCLAGLRLNELLRV